MAARAFCENPFLLNSLSFPVSYSFRLASSPVSYGRLSGCWNGKSLVSVSGISSATQSRRSQFSVHAMADVAEFSVPVASDGLTMNLKIEGTIADSLISKVTDALKKIEGISNLKVYTSEGIATVELSKQTTIQATGEASSLLETIQGEGFKLQNLSICFDDPAADADEDIAYEYETS